MVARQDTFYQRINGTVVMGSNDNATWTTISNAAQSTMEWQALTVNSAQPYRYIRLYNPNMWFGNMTELRFHARARPAPDLVQRQFHADQPNCLWVADATYIPTLAGFLYLAIVLDVFSRRIVGWAMRHSLATELMTAALDMALLQRRPHGVIHHSDQGSQYTSLAFGGNGW